MYFTKPSMRQPSLSTYSEVMFSKVSLSLNYFHMIPDPLSAIKTKLLFYPFLNNSCKNTTKNVFPESFTVIMPHRPQIFCVVATNKDIFLNNPNLTRFKN